MKFSQLEAAKWCKHRENSPSHICAPQGISQMDIYLLPAHSDTTTSQQIQPGVLPGVHEGS